MRICYIGNFEPKHSTETHIALTLEDMGHEVTRIQETKNDRFRPESAAGHDLLLWTRTWVGFVTKGDLEAVRALGVKSVSYHLDLYVGISREIAMHDDPFWATDYVFSTDGDPKSEEFFKRMGVNHHWLPAAVYKKEAKKGTFRPEYACDVAFIGTAFNYHSEWPYRNQLIQFLANTYKERFMLFGQKPGPSVRNQDLNDALASIKVVVGDSLVRRFTHENYWSDRIYETTGRGGFIVHPYIAGIETQFDLTKELVTYQFGNWEQLKGIIDFYLANEPIRNMIRDRAYTRTRREHTYHNRMATLLEVVSGR